MNIGAINTNGFTYSPKANSKPKANQSFDAVLKKAVNSEKSPEIPLKWRSTEMENAIDIAVRFMSEELDIDVSARTPTYNLTNEQVDWLKGRHNLDTIHEYNYFTPEKQNFLADLVYLNVMSPNDAKNLELATLPDHTGKFEYLGESASTAIQSRLTPGKNYKESLYKKLGIMEENIAYFETKANDPSRAEVEDMEYVEAAKKFKEQKEKCIDALLKLFP